jgi:hypothetical protein
MNLSRYVYGTIAMTAFVSQGMANVVTFDSLPSDFNNYTSYTENGIQVSLAAATGDGFYAVGLPYVASGTAAQIFSLGGTPEKMTFTTGNFSLTSIDLVNLDSGVSVKFTTPGGASLITSTVGTISFPASFENTPSVSIDFGSNSGTDTAFVIDNIVVQAVPEPVAGVWVALGLLGGAVVIKRLQANRKTK